MKVFSICIDGRKVAIVAAKTKKRAHEILNSKYPMSYYYFSEFSSETGNDVAVNIATSKPETIFISSDSLSDDYKPV